MGPGVQMAPGVVFWAQAGLVEATMSEDVAGLGGEFDVAGV